MKTLTKSLLGLGLSATLIATASFAASHASVANKTVAARHAQMQMVGYHTGILGAIAKGEMAFDAETVNAASCAFGSAGSLTSTGPIRLAIA